MNITAAFYSKLILLILFSIILEALRSTQLQGFARAESCFAEGAREMFVNKQYVAPLFYNVPYFDKPPFFYWLIISFYKLIGVSLLKARCASILAGALTIAVTSIVTRKILNEKIALLSAMILASTIGFCEFASIAMPDILLCLFANMAVFSAYQSFFVSSKQRNLYLIIMSISFAFGWMTKGPIAILIPGCVIIISLILFKQRISLSIKELFICLGIFVAILLPWHLAVYRNYGLSAFDWLYVQGNIGRFIGKHDSYNFGHNPSYIVVNLLGNFLPWTIILIPAFLHMIRSIVIPKNFSSQNKFLLLLTIWVSINTIFFSLSKSNWGYYSLSIYPALSIITASFIAYLDNRFPSRKLFKASIAIATIFFIVMATYLLTVLPVKAKKITYLHFVKDVKDLPVQTQLLIDGDLAGQYLLIDSIIFNSNHMPFYFDQEKLIDTIASQEKFIALMPKKHFDDLPIACKQVLKPIDSQPVSWLNFPGCKLASLVTPNTPLHLILVER